MKGLLRRGLLVSSSAFLIAATAVVSWMVLSGSRASSQRQAGPGPAGLAGELASSDHDASDDAGQEAHAPLPAPGGHADHRGNVGDHVEPGFLGNPDHPASGAAMMRAPQAGVTPTTVSYGPFVLPPAPLGEAHLSFLLHNVPKPCQDCFLTSLRPDLVYPDGRSANLDTGVMLHHAVWFQSGQPDITCGPETVVGRVGQRFFAAGNERTSGRFVPGFGYHVDDSSWALIIELMNHTSSPKTVNVTLEVMWRPDRPAPEAASASPDMKPLTPVWLDVGNCGDSEYSAPAGPSRKRWRWTSTLQGRVISAAGHLHDGGVKTALTNLATGRHICTSVAGYGRNAAYRGSIESMSTCNWDAIGTVREGEVLALDAYYDLSAPRDDVMGIMLAYVHETTDLVGGTRPPPQTSPETSTSPSPSPSKHEH
ncbi:MAG: hypothetical protein M3O70_22980 [Actinomycetota bacterium]|nr:hypothetical protein [Actinomycetota bacterium]